MNHIELPLLIAVEACIDFGLVILILIVQMIIYPSFRHYDLTVLKNIHSSYARTITMIVMPLMLSQICIKSWMIFTAFGWLECIGFVLVLFTWVITFLAAVPIHQGLDRFSSSLEFSQKLVKVNGYRTILWCGVFIMTVLRIIG